MMSSILIIGAGPNQLPAIRMARERGYRVVATDMDPDAEGFALADEFGIVSTRDVAATVEFARHSAMKHPISGVMTMASESAMTVAAVADALGLPGLPPVAAENATNKVKRQLLFKKHGILSPRFAIAHDAHDACKKSEELGYPVVVKPADSAGSRGVQKVENSKQMEDAVVEIRTISTITEILIEEFLTGTEHSIEGVVLNGNVIWAGLSDRNYDKKEIYPPYFLEDGDTMPTSLDPDIVRAVEEAATKAVHALGITWGPVKGDILIDDTKGIRILEMAARLSGDYFCYETIPLHNGINLLEIVMDMSMGYPIEREKLTPKYNQGVALRYVWPKPGRVCSIKGIEEARSLPGVHFVKFEPRWRDIAIGTDIQPAKSMGERVASVMASAETREKAIEIAEKAVSLIKIETIPGDNNG
ncbi:ATP-grasp domain-containing protein [Methanocalculus taiwanensis]|uniref:ATP-grasp domain-containing protein n=1 Tax=Methanocalculus taiwanensis TaxID=106207 RepID=A0ABD4TK38_9EURY|nr:ATP-grasp domain-containing protein [Methanocalculus taiwanensis]MCQ1538195.1 ATP-grasp domain-containing protein [Methanocalculus taiwanensis]